MKQYLLIIIFVFLLFTKTSEAQKNHIEFNVSPFSLFDPTHPQFRLGTEICLFEHWFIGSDFGIGFTPNYNFFSDPARDYKKYNFRQIRPAIKFATFSRDFYNFYIGIEYFYMQENNIVLNEHFYTNQGKITFSEADYFRQKEGLHFLFGTKIFPVKNVNINFYYGVGVARKYAYFSNLKKAVYHHNVYEPMYKTFSDDLFNSYKIVPHMALNLKIAWKLDFNKHKNNK